MTRVFLALGSSREEHGRRRCVNMRAGLMARCGCWRSSLGTGTGIWLHVAAGTCSRLRTTGRWWTLTMMGGDGQREKAALRKALASERKVEGRRITTRLENFEPLISIFMAVVHVANSSSRQSFLPISNASSAAYEIPMLGLEFAIPTVRFNRESDDWRFERLNIGTS
ncbi:basic leucine zipper transcriptional factor ATF-like [Striga asiatica]|uniref:Basic leucine zipper transcriptional factor ATF-like n=1 Tax=Striga asiatica TaxID=4170 RepID=A0A5A7Q958_STRAF|nr:basic leucine zipper transcriptional factor ATF-like [Striga asiatica]